MDLGLQERHKLKLKNDTIAIGKDDDGNITFIYLWHIVDGRWRNIVQEFSEKNVYYTDGKVEFNNERKLDYEARRFI